MNGQSDEPRLRKRGGALDHPQASGAAGEGGSAEAERQWMWVVAALTAFVDLGKRPMCAGKGMRSRLAIVHHVLNASALF